MKTIAKLGLAGLAIAASAAHADVFLPSTGNGELTLFVKNDVTGAVYARGLQIRMDDVLSQSAIDAGYTGDTSLGDVQTISYAINTIGPDANLTSFLQTAGTFSWTIMGGDSSGSNNASPDARRYLTTVSAITYGEDNPNTVTNNNLVTFSQLDSMLKAVNDNIDGTTGTAGDGHSTQLGGQWRQAASATGQFAQFWYGAGPDTKNDLGTAAQLYVLTTNGGGNTGTVRTYQGVDVILNTDGSLAAVGAPSEVPLPAAAWMLVSGVLTFAGVGRRRNAAATA